MAEIFDANLMLPDENQIYFLVSGNLNLHHAWRKQASAVNGVMTEFTDVYLPHVWDLRGFCESVIDSSTVSNRKLLPRFANYLAILSNGNLREIWNNLEKARKNGVKEAELDQYDRFYDLLLKEKSVLRTFSGVLSMEYTDEELVDRLQWCTSKFAYWFIKHWESEDRRIKLEEVQKITEKFEEMLPDPKLCARLVGASIDLLVSRGYCRKRRGGGLSLPTTRCSNCGSRDNRIRSRFCQRCGSSLPVEIELTDWASVQLCPQCGAANRPNAKFCQRCAYPLATSAPVTPPQLTPLPSPGALLRQGDVLQSRYRILKPLGRGGMGNTFQAEDMRLTGKLWAIKEMIADSLSPSDQQHALEQFQREAQLLATLGSVKE
jgi:hypothetical protein